MSEQEEFEKWARKDYGLKKKKNGAYRYLRTESAAEGWQACAERKDAIIDQQAEELAALRGFAKDVMAWGETYTPVQAVTNWLKKYGLIDENGNPTKLLTGEE